MNLTPFMADAAPDANSMLQFWLILSLVGGVLGNVVAIVIALSNRKQRNEVTISPDAASKKELTDHVERNQLEHDQLHTKIGGSERGTRHLIDQKITEQRQEQSEAIDKLNTKVLTLAEKVGQISAQNELQTQRLLQIDGKLDRLIERGKS